jgi:hypothetical protein
MIQRLARPKDDDGFAAALEATCPKADRPKAGHVKPSGASSPACRNRRRGTPARRPSADRVMVNMTPVKTSAD